MENLMIDCLLTHAIARQEQKPPYFFSRFNFTRMTARGNTHFCFYCGGGYGFTPDSHGLPTNQLEESGHDPMKNHDPVGHGDGIIDEADKYKDPWDWLEGKISKNFPFIVSIPGIS